MSSTRNKNTPGNYALERWSDAKINTELMYIHAAQGQAMTTQLPGDGLLASKIAGRDLANNYCDIESALFGIGSTNLENPLPKVNPEINYLRSLNIIQKTPSMVKPQKYDIQPNQRPMYLN
jgi:hypothetical protein